MTDVIFMPGVVGRSNVIPGDYAGQDLESQSVGVAVPFTYSVQFGFVSFGYDFISPTPSFFHGFDSQDMEALADGAITEIPATIPPLGPAVPEVLFLVGKITQIVNAGEESLEFYDVGTITQINQSVSLGDVEMKIGSLF